MSTQPFTKKQISLAIENAVNNSLSCDDSENFIQEEKYSWDDLNTLKDTLANSVVDFIGQVNSIITNQEVIANLGNNAPLFNQLVKVFFSDINEFSNKVSPIRIQHENKTGLITSLEEFDVYNRLAIQYHVLYTELSTLLTPTLSELVFLVSDIVAQSNTSKQEGDSDAGQQ